MRVTSGILRRPIPSTRASALQSAALTTRKANWDCDGVPIVGEFPFKPWPGCHGLSRFRHRARIRFCRFVLCCLGSKASTIGVSPLTRGFRVSVLPWDSWLKIGLCLFYLLFVFVIYYYFFFGGGVARIRIVGFWW